MSFFFIIISDLTKLAGDIFGFKNGIEETKKENDFAASMAYVQIVDLEKTNSSHSSLTYYDERFVSAISSLLCFAVSEKCAKRSVYINRIMGLDRDVQVILMKIIQPNTKANDSSTPSSVSKQESRRQSTNTSYLDELDDDDGDDESLLIEDDDIMNHSCNEGIDNMDVDKENMPLNLENNAHPKTLIVKKSERFGLSPYRSPLIKRDNIQYLSSPWSTVSRGKRDSLEYPNSNRVKQNYLQREIQDLKTKHTELINELSVARQRENQLSGKLDEVESKYLAERLKVESESLKKESRLRDEIENEKRILQEEIMQLRDQLRGTESAKDQLVALQDEVDVLRHSSERLKHTEEQLRKLKDKLEILGDTKAALEREEEAHSAAVSKCLSLENELSNLQPLRRQLEEYKARAVDAEVKLADCESSLCDLKEENVNLTDLNKELQKGVLLQQEDADEMRRKLLRDGEHLRGEGLGDGINEFNPVLKEELLRLRNENIRLKAFAEKREEDAVQKMEEKLDDSDRLATQFKEYYVHTKRKLEETETCKRKTEDQLFSTNGLLKETQETLQTTQNKLKITQGELDEKKETLTKTSNELFSTRGLLKETQEILQTTQNKLKITQDNLDDTKHCLATTKEEMFVTSGLLKETQETLQTTQNKLKRTQDDLDDAKDTVVKTDENKEILEKKLASTELTLATTNDALSNTQRTLFTTNEALTEREQSLSRTKRLLDDTREQKAKLEATLSKTQEDLCETTKKLERNEHELETTTKELLDTKNNLQHSDENLREVRASGEQLKLNLTQTEEKLSQTKKLLEKTDENLIDVQKSYDDSQKKLSRITEEKKNVEQELESTKKSLNETATSLEMTTLSLEENKKSLSSSLEREASLEEEITGIKNSLNQTSTILKEKTNELNATLKIVTCSNQKIEKLEASNVQLKQDIKDERLASQKASIEAERILQSTKRNLVDKSRNEHNSLETRLKREFNEERNRFKENIERITLELNNSEVKSSQIISDLRKDFSNKMRESREKFQEEICVTENEFKSKLAIQIKEAAEERENLVEKGKNMIKEIKSEYKNKIRETIDSYEEKISKKNEEQAKFLEDQKVYEEKAKALISKYKHKLSVAQEQQNDTSTKYDALHVSMKKLEREKMTLKGENEKLKKQISGRYGSDSNSNNELSMLQKEFNILLEENRRLKHEKASEVNFSTYLDNSTSDLMHASDFNDETNVSQSYNIGDHRDSVGNNNSTIALLRTEYEDTIEKLKDEKRELIMRNSAAASDAQRSEQKVWDLENDIEKLKNEVTSLKLNLERSERHGPQPEVILSHNRQASEKIASCDLSTRKNQSNDNKHASTSHAQSPTHQNVESTKNRETQSISSKLRKHLQSPSSKKRSDLSGIFSKRKSKYLKLQGDGENIPQKKTPISLVESTNAPITSSDEGNQECTQS